MRGNNTERAKLIRAEAPPDIGGAIRRRIVYAQGLYAFGAALGFLHVGLGIAFIILVQLNYVIAPRLPILYKL